MRSQLNGRKRSKPMHSPCWSLEIPSWNNKLVTGGDRCHRGLHMYSSTLRLYEQQKEGGWGLRSVRATIQDETRSICEYIPLNGMFHWQREEVADIKKSYQWPEMGGLKKRIEVFYHGSTRTGTKHQINRGRTLLQLTGSRLQRCHGTDQHRAAGCKVQAETANTEAQPVG